MSRWFRMYDEVLDDPKVQSLDGDTFKAWINLLCLANRNDGILPDEQTIAFALRTDIIGARSVVDRLRIATLIDPVKGGRNGKRYAIHGWSKRQYKSDSSTERTKRFRERSRNGGATPPDTEQIQIQNTPPTPPQNAGGGERSFETDRDGVDANGEAERLKPEHVVEAWNELAGRTGLARIDQLTTARLRKVEAMIARHDVATIGKALDTIEATPFLRNGEGGSWGGANFDWLTNPDNFTKLIEGQYGQPAH